MALSPEQAALQPSTLEDYVWWLEVQIDAFLTAGWHDPSRTCFHVPSYLKQYPWYDRLLELVIEKYRPMWPHLHRFSAPATYTCDFLAFVTEPCENHAAA